MTPTEEIVLRVYDEERWKDKPIGPQGHMETLRVTSERTGVGEPRVSGIVYHYRIDNN